MGSCRYSPSPLEGDVLGHARRSLRWRQGRHNGMLQLPVNPFKIKRVGTVQTLRFYFNKILSAGSAIWGFCTFWIFVSSSDHFMSRITYCTFKLHFPQLCRFLQFVFRPKLSPSLYYNAWLPGLWTGKLVDYTYHFTLNRKHLSTMDIDPSCFPSWCFSVNNAIRYMLYGYIFQMDAGI